MNPKQRRNQRKQNTRGGYPFIPHKGPVTILGVGLAFDTSTETLTLALDGTLRLGPIKLTLLGFQIGFTFGDEATLTDFITKIKPTVRLDGLGISFQKDPLTIAGLFEHKLQNGLESYSGGAVVGFDPWAFEAVGYYGKSTISKDKLFFTYVRLNGPVATIGYAEIRGLVGGFGCNTSVRFPNMQNIQDFPFLQGMSEKPTEALSKMLDGGWFAVAPGQNWVAAGLTVLAFQTLTVTAVVVVEWGSGMKLGIFGLATAEMPKQLEIKICTRPAGHCSNRRLRLRFHERRRAADARIVHSGPKLPPDGGFRVV